MKRFIIVALTLVLGYVGLQAQNQPAKITWLSMDQMIRLHKETRKPILIDVYTDWCRWCKVMDEQTFSHPVIADYISKHFYAVKFNAEGDEVFNFGGTVYGLEGNKHSFTTALGVTGYPTIAYFTDGLEYMGPMAGFQKPADIEPLLHYIIEKKYLEEDFASYKAKFQGVVK